MSDFCQTKFDGLGTGCTRCGCWKRGTEHPDCPKYVTRVEPDGARLPHIKTRADNEAARDAYLAKLDAEIDSIQVVS